MSSKHIIKKQIIELEMGQSLDRADIQSRVSRIYQQEIVPLLDQLLSNKSASSPLIIDHLEINIGQISEGRLEQVLAEKVGKALQESLNEIKISPAPETVSIVKLAGAARRESHSDTELVIYFLQTGVFPWWAQETTYAWLEKAFRSVLHQNSANFKRVFAALVQDEDVIKRLVYTFSDALLAQAAEQLTSTNVTIPLLQKEQLSPIFSNGLSAQQLQAYWWLSVYQTITAASFRSEKDLFEEAGSLFVRLAAQKSNRTDLLQFLQNDRTTNGILEKIDRFTKQQFENNNQEQFSRETAENYPSSLGSGDKTAIHLKDTLDTPFINDSKPAAKSFTDIDKIYIQNAGLVLFWPFLQRFFQNIGLIDDKTFTNENNAERACLILQYLATGSTEEIFEAQLPLNKMLCGIPLLQPVNTQWVISDEEKDIAENFLLAVIQNGGTGWKNLSVGGLRQAYLNREGIISGRDGNWLLQVKRETYDLLVDRLPWTIQVVKLPWMERLMFVEW